VVEDAGQVLDTAGLHRTSVYAQLLITWGTLLRAKGEPHQALVKLRKALEVYDDDSPLPRACQQWGSLMRLVAMTQDSLEQLNDSNRSYEDARWAFAASVGKSHPEYGDVVMKLSSILLRLEKLDEALIACKEARHVFETNPGCTQQYAAVLMNTAIVYKKQEKLEEALALLKEACRKYEATAGDQSLEYALCLYNTAMVLGSMDNLSEAGQLFQQSAELYETQLGVEHPQARAARHYLAQCGTQANSGAAPPPYQPPSPTAGMAIPAQYATEDGMASSCDEPPPPSYEEASATPPYGEASSVTSINTPPYEDISANHTYSASDMDI